MFKKILLFAATLLLLCQTPLPARANPVDCLQIPVKGEGTNYLHRLELCNTDALPADDDTQVVS